MKIIFVGAVAVGSKNPDAAKALLDYLKTPEAVVVFQGQGRDAGIIWTVAQTGSPALLVGYGKTADLPRLAQPRGSALKLRQVSIRFISKPRSTKECVSCRSVKNSKTLSGLLGMMARRASAASFSPSSSNRSKAYMKCVGLHAWPFLQSLEDRQSASVADYDLTIDDAGAATQREHRGGNRRIAVAPIMAIAGEQSHAAGITPCDQAETVVFDLVQPAAPSWPCTLVLFSPYRTDSEMTSNALPEAPFGRNKRNMNVSMANS
jgi:hypothetical protein